MFIENEHPSDLKPQWGDMCIEQCLCNLFSSWLVKESKFMQPEPLQNWKDRIVIDEADSDRKACH